MGNRKVLVAINDLNFGGAQKLAVEQANRLFVLGYKVSFLIFFDNREQSFEKKILSGINIYKIKNSKFNFITFFRCFKFIYKNRFDLIFTHLFFSNTLVRAVSIFLWRKPFIISYEHNVYTGQKSSLSLQIDYFLSSRSDLIIAVSEEVKNYLIEKRINSKKILLVNNGINLLEPKNLVNLKRKELNISNDKFIIVSVGNVDYQKGHDILVEAANLIIKKFPNCIFLVCGNDSNKVMVDKIKAKIVKYGLENEFKLLGNRADVEEIVEAADIFVMPSRFEGLSIALLEAMSLKKAIVVSDIDSMKNILTNGNNGIFFSTEDPVDLAEKIIGLVPDSILREKLGRVAYSTVQNYSIENNVINIIKAVESLKKRKHYFFNKYNLNHQKSLKWTERSKEALELFKNINFTNKIIKIADLGCGDKKLFELINKLKNLEFTYKGFDIMPQADDVEKINLSENVINEEFDVVFCLGLIEYLKNIDFFFANLVKISNYVILSCVVSDYADYNEKVIRRKGWENYLSVKQLEMLIKKYGFEIIKSKMIDNGVTYLCILKKIETK
ncbi:MAG: Glycosyl transferase group 1 [Candidatus Magasanikbacteria bacterium GW2011_GWC2_37_14]|uniref:Glycosyl transferase group 1 n=1 Tax=Candidatus Magasanikbacteria bacterium GW2011_GWC2_37_14 TaxID=1619046 RepID=A0A0G0IUR0_9BACT|nr:MAG: Glycosyl transferase group 1 [Candidatus Magasanikbacteria bacterium GW2011_GWC2_37_14]